VDDEGAMMFFAADDDACINSNAFFSLTGGHDCVASAFAFGCGWEVFAPSTCCICG
jgi:hypothetical protein